MTSDEVKKDWIKKQNQAEKRLRERAITLRELLIAMEPESPLPDEWESWDDFRPHSVYRILLCFMSEEETWIEAYRDHVMLIPWYDCKVIGFNADDKFILQVWLAYEHFLKNYKQLNAKEETDDQYYYDQT